MWNTPSLSGAALEVSDHCGLHSIGLVCWNKCCWRVLCFLCPERKTNGETVNMHGPQNNVNREYFFQTLCAAEMTIYSSQKQTSVYYQGRLPAKYQAHYSTTCVKHVKRGRYIWVVSTLQNISDGNSYRAMEQRDRYLSELGVGCFQTSVGPGDFVTHLPQRFRSHSLHFNTAVLV